MTLVSIYHDPYDIERYSVNDIEHFIKHNITLLQSGYRIYDGTASQATDITINYNAIMNAEKIVILKPANGPLAIAASIAVAVIAVAVIVFMPIPEPPSTANQNQQSSTNSLGERRNTYNKGGRVDDIFGAVNGHVPSIIERPIRRYIDNVEVENFTVLIGRGNYEQSNQADGESLIKGMDRAKYNSFDSGNNPNKGDTPDINIGGLITRKPVVSDVSRELSSVELLPPNEISDDPHDWEMIGSVNDFDITIVNPAPATDLTLIYEVGDTIRLNDFISTIDDGFFTIVAPLGGTTEDINAVLVFDISPYEYIIKTVTAITITLEYPLSLPAQIKTSIQNYNANVIEKSFLFNNGKINVSLTGTEDYTGWTYQSGGGPVSYVTTNYSPLVSGLREGVIGPFTIPKSATHYVLNYVANGGFYNLFKGNPEVVTADIEIVIDELDSNDDPTGVRSTQVIQISSNTENIRQQSAITIEQVKPFPNCRVESSRLTERLKEENYVNVDKVNWSGLYFYREISNTHDYGDCTIAQIEIRASQEAQQVNERQINLDVIRKIDKYIGNGSFTPQFATTTIAEVTIAIALDQKNGRLTLNQIDADGLLLVQQQLIDYYGFPEIVNVGYSIDSNKLRFQEIFTLFWESVRCRTYSQNAVYKVYPRIERDVSTKQFTHRNKIAGTDKRERKFGIRREFDSVIVKYRDNEKKEEIEVTRTIDGEFNNSQTITLTGAIDGRQAELRADYEINVLKFQADSVEFESDSIGLLTVAGERVDNVDYTRINKRTDNTGTLKIFSGQIEAIDGLVVQLSEPVLFEVGTYTIRFTKRNGDISEAIPVTAGSTSYHVVLSSLPIEQIYTGYQANKTTYTLASDSERLSMPIIIEDITSGNSKGIDSRKLKGINYDTRYFAEDKQFAV